MKTQNHPLLKRINEELQSQKTENLYRDPLKIDKVEKEFIYSEGKKLINFCSNDSLGLGDDPELNRTLQKIIQENNIGGGSSRLVSANRRSLLEAEQFYADFFGYESAIFFSSGYLANLALVSTLFNEKDSLFYDKQIHASMVEGMKLSRATFKGFNHNDFAHLQKRLKASLITPNPQGEAVQALLVESCYSMAGDSPDFGLMSEVATDHNLITLVDEAHALGILGEQGKGLCHDAGFKPDVLVGTFGKAFGYSGAFLLMSHTLKEYFLNFSSPLIYTTASRPYTAPYLVALLKKVATLDERRTKVQENATYCRRLFQEGGISTGGQHHIIGIEIGDEQAVMQIAKVLQGEGFLVAPIRFPTVARNKAMLRVGIGYHHQTNQIEQLVETITKEIYNIE